MDQSWILIDQSTGLHVGWYFWLRVLDEANRSSRYGNPFGLLLLEAEPRSGGGERVLEEAAARVPAAVRSTDLAGTVGAGRVGVVLPHQDVPSAEAAARKIVDRLAEQASNVIWHSRLLCYPGDAAEISNLLTLGWTERHGRDGNTRLELPA